MTDTWQSLSNRTWGELAQQSPQESDAVYIKTIEDELSALRADVETLKARVNELEAGAQSVVMHYAEMSLHDRLHGTPEGQKMIQKIIDKYRASR